MPFLNQIATFINDTLKAGSLNSAKLQPAKYNGISTAITRKKGTELEILPAIIEDGAIKKIISPDSKIALEVYHKVISNIYSYEKKSYGDSYDIKSVTEMTMVVCYSSKLTGKAKEVLEPVIIFGMPQRLSKALTAELQIGNCLITPLSSNMDPVAVFKQEFPKADYFLNENTSMFSIRYKIEMTLSQACVNGCLC